MSVSGSLTLECAVDRRLAKEGTPDRITFAEQGGELRLETAMRGDNFYLDKADARKLFNYLGAWLHKY